MSKIVILIILVCTALPFIIFLAFGETQPQESPNIPEEILLEKQKPTEPRPEDSPQCGLCRQISDTESQNQCLKDFACSI